MAFSDTFTEQHAKDRCEAVFRQSEFRPDFNEKLAIRHHRMTIALAMPQRGKNGF
jgi:hypothetical protein